MERKIGETFEYEGKVYKTIQSLPDSCRNCAFVNEPCYASIFNKIVGGCSMTVREDKNNIIFKEIKKDMEIKDNQLTINIPDGMEIDLQNSNFDAGVIKFKMKELTYEDIKASLKLNENMIVIDVANENVNRLYAINRLMCIAEYYNGNWKPNWSNNKEGKFYISYNFIHNAYFVIEDNSNNVGTIVFKHKEDAQAVIENPNFREILDVIYKN